MFTGEPPSSSNPTKRHRVGASALFSTRFVGFSCRSAARTSRARIALCSRLLRRRSETKSVSPLSSVHCSLRSLRLAPVSRCLPHSLADEERVCSLDSSRTAARQPGSVRRRAIRARTDQSSSAVSPNPECVKRLRRWDLPDRLEPALGGRRFARPAVLAGVRSRWDG